MRAVKEVSPYTVGDQISLHLDNGVYLEATIDEVMTFTLSCVLLVQVQQEEFPARCIVKLYDRRFATQLRTDECASPWDSALEKEYQEFVLEGKVKPIFTYWSVKFAEDTYWEDPTCESWDATYREAYLQFQSWTSYSTETQAYNLMDDLQGESIPRLLGKSTSMLELPPYLKSPEYKTLVGCPGIVLEFIDGFPLTDIQQKVDHESWQTVCEKAVDVVALIGQRGIVNRDVKTRSFILQKHDENDFNVFMIDFGLCFFRDQAKDDDEFEEWQADQDEEGAVGFVMQRKLDGGFVYHRSERAQYLSAKYKSES